MDKLWLWLTQLDAHNRPGTGVPGQSCLRPHGGGARGERGTREAKGGKKQSPAALLLGVRGWEAGSRKTETKSRQGLLPPFPNGFCANPAVREFDDLLVNGLVRRARDVRGTFATPSTAPTGTRCQRAKPNLRNSNMHINYTYVVWYACYTVDSNSRA